VKFWVCKRAPALVYESMECLGGNGYVEESLLPRLYREAPVNAIWEGSGNVMGLDVLRAFASDKEAARTVLTALAGETTGLAGISGVFLDIEAALAAEETERYARILVERLALLATAAAMHGSAPAFVADIFARTRFGERRNAMPGACMINATDATALMERALPV
jgi:putative acyl-CoA dehydrogenase